MIHPSKHYEQARHATKTWLDRVVCNPTMRRVNKDNPELSLKKVIEGDAEEFVLLPLALDSLSTWHLMMYENEAMTRDAGNFDELAIAARYFEARVYAEDELIKDKWHSGLLPTDAALSLSVMAILGWKESFLRTGSILLSGIDNDLLDLSKQAEHQAGALYRHFWFALEMYAHMSEQKIDSERYSYPGNMHPYSDVLKDWETLDVGKIRNLVEELAEFHVEMAYLPDHGTIREFDTEDRMVFPYEILLLLRLREWKGLPNPTAFHHPLMSQPLARMPTGAVPYPHIPLLDDAIIQFGKRHSGDVSRQ